MKVLITGAGGQLGRDLQLHCEAQGDEVVAATHATLDVADRDAVYQASRPCGPTWCCTPGRTRRSTPASPTPTRPSGSTPWAPAGWPTPAAGSAPTSCYVSTDYVFDGTKDEPYVEWDRPNPQSVYGRSKLGGEHEVAGHAPGSSIVRTSWVCGEHGNNMVKTVLKLADRPELAFVDDQRGHPDLHRRPGRRHPPPGGRPGCPGLFHMTNQGEVSWYEFVRAILESAGHDPAKVRPIKTDDLDPPRPAPRPGQLGARQRRAPAGRLPAAAALPREPRPPGRPPHRRGRLTHSAQQVEAAGQVADHAPVGVEAVAHRPPLVEPGVHRRHQVGPHAAVLGEVEPAAGVDHPPVEAVEQRAQPADAGAGRRA